ncbi:uncharacterized protein BDZ99DRAFT_382489, partial [Mytilinidion resinicola]
QAEQKNLEQKNHELVEAFREKSKTQQQIQKLYQSLKAQVMASHVATAATDEAEHTIHTSRRDLFVDRIPGTRKSAPISTTPSQHRSRLPVAHSGARNNVFLGGESSQQFGNAMNSQTLHDLNSNGGGPSGYRFSNGLKSSSRQSGGLRRTAAANLHRGTASQNLPVR